MFVEFMVHHVVLVLVSNPLEFRVLVMFCHQIFFATFIIYHTRCHPKLCSQVCSKCSIDLRINLLQSLVQGLCVAAEKRETEGTKKTKVVAVQKKSWC
jgi:hypothetical protein